MLDIDSRDEAAMQRLIANPETVSAEYSEAAREAARCIRSFFVRERGWTDGQLRRYRFRDLTLLSRQGQVVLAEREGPQAWARQQDDYTLELLLTRMYQQGRHKNMEMVERMTKPERKTVPLEERRLALRPEQWEYLESLVNTRVGRIDKRSRVSGAQLARGLYELLESAYGR